MAFHGILSANYAHSLNGVNPIPGGWVYPKSTFAFCYSTCKFNTFLPYYSRKVYIQSPVVRIY